MRAGVERRRHGPEVVVADELHLSEPADEAGEAEHDEQGDRDEAALVGAGAPVAAPVVPGRPHPYLRRDQASLRAHDERHDDAATVAVSRHCTATVDEVDRRR